MAEKISLYKYHSYAACIGEGFRFLAKQLLLVSKVMLPYFTASSLFAVLYIAIYTKLGVAMQAYGQVEPSDLLTAIALFVLTAVAYIIANGRMFLMFRRLTGAEITMPGDEAKNTAAWKTTLTRTMQLSVLSLPYLIWGFLLNIPGFTLNTYVIDFLSKQSQEIKILALFILMCLGIVLIVFLTPIIYTYYCRMMQPSYIDMTTEEGREQKKAFSFKAAYRKGLNHKGKILGVAALSSFIVGVASLILLLPGIISINAYFSSVEGSINFSDQALIPTNGYVYMIIVSTLALTLAQILSVSAHAALLYLHGDIYSNS